MPIALDPQLSGAAEEFGSPDGVVRNKLVRGELIRQPFLSNTPGQQTNVNGAATGTYNVGQEFKNPDGSSSYISLGNNGAAIANGVELWVPFAGRTFGIRWRQ